jgi:hypothetical protein
MFSIACALFAFLFCVPQNVNRFVFMRSRALLQKTPGWGAIYD